MKGTIAACFFSANKAEQRREHHRQVDSAVIDLWADTLTLNWFFIVYCALVKNNTLNPVAAIVSAGSGVSWRSAHFLGSIHTESVSLFERLRCIASYHPLFIWIGYYPICATTLSVTNSIARIESSSSLPDYGREKANTLCLFRSSPFYFYLHLVRLASALTVQFYSH